MKSINVLYKNTESVTQLIEQGELHFDAPYSIQIVTASEDHEGALEIARFAQSTFPNATIMGFSTCGIIYRGESFAEGTILVFRLFEKTQPFQALFSWEGKEPKDVAKEIADTIADKDARVMHVLCGGRYYGVHDFVENFNKYNSTTAMVGGVAGDILSKNTCAFVFTPEVIMEKGIIILALCGDEFNFYSGVNTAHEPISGKHRLTKSNGTAWQEINGQEIRQWMFEQLGVEKLETYSDWAVRCANDTLVHFPMILEGYQSASRFLHYNDENDSIATYYSMVPEGTEFRIGYVNPIECLQESFSLCNEIMNKPVEDLFCYSCLFRRLYLESCSHWELSPYKNLGLCGGFMMGEIGNVNGHNEVLNGACCLLTVAENETYVRPNIQAFEKLTSIGADTTDLLNTVLKRQQEASTRQNERLIKTLLDQQETQKEQLYIDFNTGIPNYLKYKEDLNTHRFDKLFVMKTENAELLITHLGHTAYLKIIREVLNKLQEKLETLYNREKPLIQLYVFNETTFFIASDERMSESHFMRFCNKAHDSLHILPLENEEVVVSRFVVCLNQENPIESALNTLAANQNTQNSFLICTDSGNGTSTDDEFKMIGVLNRAFENDGVTPYFQGIYNNIQKRISYYEALIRICDIDGTIYAPGQFIGVAKKYHMYSTLSRTMISKVFDLFANINQIVSINISAFDIHSETTNQMIFERLKSCKYPQNFIFEILEDEAYQDFAPLKEFIGNVRKLGAKVAIDDFGAGYSNLYEISTISFDIIKVDGSIIRNIPDNECNRKLLDVITHMGLLFEAKIVAEFVENQDIQNILEETGIGFSQGYLFAKPIPFSELDLSQSSNN